MAIKFNSSVKDDEHSSIQKRKPNQGHCQALPVSIDLNKPGWLRVGHLMTLFSVSHATLYNRIKSGAIPKPDGKDGARPFWRTDTIKKVLEQ